MLSQNKDPNKNQNKGKQKENVFDSASLFDFELSFWYKSIVVERKDSVLGLNPDCITELCDHEQAIELLSLNALKFSLLRNFPRYYILYNIYCISVGFWFAVSYVFLELWVSMRLWSKS